MTPEPISINKITQAQHKGRSIAELAPWLFAVGDQVIVNKDSGLMACYEYSGMDTDSVSEEILHAMGLALNKALVLHQNEPLMQWWQLQRRRTDTYPHGAFTSPVGAQLDAERRADFLNGQNFVNRQFFTQVMHPYSGFGKIAERFSRSLSQGGSIADAIKVAWKTFWDDQHAFAYTVRELDEAIKRHQQILDDFLGRIPGITFKRLKGNDLGGFLHSMISPQAAKRLPKLGIHPVGDRMLDESIPEGWIEPNRDYLFHHGTEEAYSVAITVTDFDQEIAIGALDRLFSVPGEITLTLALQFMSHKEAVTHAESLRDYHRGKLSNWKAVAKATIDSNGGNPDPATMNSGRAKLASEANECLGRLTVKELSMLRCFITVVCHGHTLDEADTTAERVTAILSNAGLKVEKEEMHALSAFATGIPGNWKECARWNPFPSEAFSLIAPIHGVSSGQFDTPYLTEQTGVQTPAMTVLPTDYNTPFYFTPYYGDLGHGFLVGKSRGGKTTMLNFLWSQFMRFHGAQLFILDNRFSSRIPILLQGGSYQDFSTNSGKGWNPLKYLDESNFEWTKDWLELLCSISGLELKSEESKDLEFALRSLMDLSDESKRLSTLMSTCSSRNLVSALEPWTGDRVLGRYFDNEDDNFDLDCPIIGTSLDGIIDNAKVSAPALMYIFKRIETHLANQRLKGQMRPTFIGVPEIWLGLKVPFFRARIENLLKTLGKLGAVVWMDTQSLDDLLKSGVYATLRDCIPNKIFVSDPAVTTPSLAELFMQELQLSFSQLQRIAAGTWKRDYFFIQGDVSRMVSLQFPPESLAKLRSDVKAQIVFDTHYKAGQGEPGWEQRYLEDVVKV